MVHITPGLAFLAQNLVGPGLGFTACVLGTRYLALPIPAWAIALLSLLSVPGRIVGGILWTEFRDRREAERLGARLVPRAKGKRFANLDVLEELLGHWRNGYPGDGIWELVDTLGLVNNFNVLFANNIFTVCPEHIKLILATDFDNYDKGERFRFAMGGVLGSGVFNSDGKMWQFHRSMTRPFFNRDRMTDFELFDKHADTVISLIKSRMLTGESIDFQDVMHRFTLDAATEHLFGSCVDSLRTPSGLLPLPFNSNSTHKHTQKQGEGEEENLAIQFSAAFLQAQIVIAERERYGRIWPLLEIFKDRAREPMEVVNRYLDPVIRDAVGRYNEKKAVAGEKGEVEEEGGETLLDHLVTLTSDTALLRDETLNILIAARDTMAATLSFMFYFLSLHPSVLARLRQEASDRVGGTRRPTYEDVKEMKYLKATLNETLRLLPPVPFNVRECQKGAIWPSPDPSQKPLYIPPGSATAYSVIMMHTRTDLWGPTAHEFDPDRFLDERLKEYLLPNPFIFLPFNAGPRICLGQQFAYNQMSFMAIRLLQSFSSFTLDTEAFPPSARPPVEWAEQGRGRKRVERFRPQIVLTMSSTGGMWMKAGAEGAGVDV